MNKDVDSISGHEAYVRYHSLERVAAEIKTVLSVQSTRKPARSSHLRSPISAVRS